MAFTSASLQAGRESLTVEQHQFLGWLERDLDRQLEADPPGDERHRLTVWVRMTPAMMRDLELRYHQRGWASAQTRTMRDGTHLLELGRG